jgi:predicted ester cyclase
MPAMIDPAIAAADAKTPSSREPSALVRLLHDEVINNDRLDLLDELIAPDYVNHGPFPWGVYDREDLRRFYIVRELGFPDVHVTTDDMLEVGDLVAYRVTIRGTDTGEVLGLPATGQSVEISGAGFARIRGGQIVEHWGLVDELGLLQQVGADLASIRLLADRRERRGNGA